MCQKTMGRSLLSQENIDVDILDFSPYERPVQVGPVRKVTNLDKLTECPRCGKPLVPALALSGVESTFFKECPDCGTLVNSFKPLPHQADFMRHPARFKMAAGG